MSQAPELVDPVHRTSQSGPFVCIPPCANHCIVSAAGLEGVSAYDREIERVMIATVIPLRRLRNALVGAGRVPAEVLQTILHLCAPATDLSKIAARNALSHVCYSWRQVALGDWTLWTHIDLGLPRLSRELFARCAGFPTSVYLTVLEAPDQARCGRLREAIANALERTEYIQELDLCVMASFAIKEIGPTFAQARHRFARLQHACIVMSDSVGGTDINDRIPLYLHSIFSHPLSPLRKLHLDRTFVWWDDDMIRNLTELSLVGTLPLIRADDWYHLLTIARLHSLILSGEAVPVMRSVPPDLRYDQPYLSRIEVNGSFEHTATLLSYLNLPIQVSVKVSPTSNKPSPMNSPSNLALLIRRVLAHEGDVGALSVVYEVKGYSNRSITVISPSRQLKVVMIGFLRDDEYVIEEVLERAGPTIVDRIQTLGILHMDTVDFYVDSSTWSRCFHALIEVVDVTVTKGSASGLFSMWSRTPESLPKVHTLRVLAPDEDSKRDLLASEMAIALQQRAQAGRAIRHLYLSAPADIPTHIVVALEAMNVSISYLGAVAGAQGPE
jgi:hypothetical protein